MASLSSFDMNRLANTLGANISSKIIDRSKAIQLAGKYTDEEVSALRKKIQEKDQAELELMKELDSLYRSGIVLPAEQPAVEFKKEETK